MSGEQEAEAGVGIDDTSPLLIAVTSRDNKRSGDGSSVADNEPDWPGRHDFEGLPWWNRPSIYWLVPAYLLFTLAYGGSAIPKLNLIKNLICRDYYAERAVLHPDLHYDPIRFSQNNDQCRTPQVQSRSVQFMLIGSVISGSLSALTSPKLGALSDRYGRKTIISITTVGGLVGEIITILAASSPETFNVNWLMLSFLIDGLCGSFTTGMAISHAYATDCTPPSRRNVAFGYFHGVMFVGIALGPLLAGLIIKATGTLLVMFYLTFACHLFFLFCLTFIIPESLTKSRQLAARQKHAQQKAEALPGSLFTQNGWFDDCSPLSPFRPLIVLFHRASGGSGREYNPLAPLKVLYPTGPGSSPALRRNMVLLAAIDTVMFGVAMGSITVVMLYLDFQFHWDTAEQSYFMSIVNICRVVMLFIALPLVTRCVLGRSKSRRQSPIQHGCDQLDMGLIRGAIFFDTLGYLGYTLVRSGPLFVLSGCVASFGGIGSPTLQSALTKHVPHDRVGQLLGANGLLHALARVVSPIIFNSIYSKTVGKFTQTVFVCLTCSFGAALIMSLFVRPGQYLHDDNSSSDNGEGVQDADIR